MLRVAFVTRLDLLRVEVSNRSSVMERQLHVYSDG